jgi:hypothetical protein
MTKTLLGLWHQLLSLLRRGRYEREMLSIIFPFPGRRNPGNARLRR